MSALAKSRGAKRRALRMSDYEIRNAISGVDLAHNFLTRTGGNRTVAEHRTAIRKAAQALMQIDADLDAREEEITTGEKLAKCAEAFERRNQRIGEELCNEGCNGNELPVLDRDHITEAELPDDERATYIPVDTLERQRQRKETGERFITSDDTLISEMNRWEALRWNGVPADQTAADRWYEIKEYSPRTSLGRKRRNRFLGLFPYVALKRSAAMDVEERG